MDDACKKDLREVLFRMLDDIRLSDTTVSFTSWDKSKTRLLNSLLAAGAVKETELVQRIHERILRIGMDCFDEHKKGEYPDHVASVNAFAYALHHGVFTEAEKKGIVFDFDETLQVYVERYYKENFPELILSKLRTERDFSFLAGCHADHCCCH